MKHTNLFLMTLVAGVLAAPMAANAVTVVGNSNVEPVLGALEAFSAEGRFGDLGGAAEKEIKVSRNGGQPGVGLNFAWGNNVVNPFTLEYDASIGEVKWTVAGQPTLVYNHRNMGVDTVLGSVSDLYIRAFSSRAGTSILINNLKFDGNSLGNVQAYAAAGAPDRDILHLSNISGSFILSGDATFTYATAGRYNSNPAFQIKGVVPEPGSVFALLTGGVSLLALRRRRS